MSLTHPLWRLALSTTLVGTFAASAAQYTLSIKGTDAIWLAGRSDLVIPPYIAGDPPGWILDRHNFGTPEGLAETFPPWIPVVGGDVVRASDPAVGGVSFFNGIGAPFYGPEGNPALSTLSAIGGISGWEGTQGPLVGVFLTDAVPDTGPAPATLSFDSPAERDFASLSPAIGQLFFIGDGLNSADEFQEFIAPAGATRLFLGIPDGFAFLGPPGAYDDNDGSYRIRIAVNDIPVPEAPTYAAALGVALLAGLQWRRRQKH